MAAELGAAARLLVAELPVARALTIVDVGANPVNEPPYAALLAEGACKVVGFEPQPSAWEELQKVKGAHETYFPHAVGDGEKARLHVFRVTGLTSILPPHEPGLRLVGGPRWTRVVEELEMETVTLDGMADLPEFDLLKIDIQGGEKLVFEHARRVMASAICVIVELRWLRIYEGEPMAGGLDQELRAQGFQLHRFMFNKSVPLPNSQSSRLRPRRVSDQLIDGDGVYLRDITDLSVYSDDQLMHLALMASAIFESHSLVLHVLDALVARGGVAEDLPGRYVDLLPRDLRAD